MSGWYGIHGRTGKYWKESARNVGIWYVCFHLQFLENFGKNLIGFGIGVHWLKHSLKHWSKMRKLMMKPWTSQTLTNPQMFLVLSSSFKGIAGHSCIQRTRTWNLLALGIGLLNSTSLLRWFGVELDLCFFWDPYEVRHRLSGRKGWPACRQHPDISIRWKAKGKSSGCWPYITATIPSYHVYVHIYIYISFISLLYPGPDPWPQTQEIQSTKPRFLAVVTSWRKWFFVSPVNSRKRRQPQDHTWLQGEDCRQVRNFMVNELIPSPW